MDFKQQVVEMLDSLTTDDLRKVFFFVRGLKE